MKTTILFFLVLLFAAQAGQAQKLHIPEMDKLLIEADETRSWMIENCKGRNYMECYDAEKKRNYIYKDAALTITESITESDGTQAFFYKLTYKYYPNNQLQYVTIAMNTSGMSGNMYVGTWYYYHENGKLFQKIKHEKRFKHDYYDVAKKAKNLGIKNPIISRNFSKKKSYWLIESFTKGEYTNIKRTQILEDKNLKVVFDKSSNQKDYWDRYQYNFDDYRHHIYDYFWGVKKLSS